MTISLDKILYVFPGLYIALISIIKDKRKNISSVSFIL